MKTEKSSFSFKYALLAMLMFFSVGVMAQTTVTGTVLDDLGEGAVGAVVREKGSQGGVTTDVSGKFSISVSKPNAVLTVSYVGFQSQEVSLNGRNKVTIRLKMSESQNLEEQVVIGHGGCVGEQRLYLYPQECLRSRSTILREIQ